MARKRWVPIAVLLPLAAGALSLTAPASAADAKGQVYVVHGIPGAKAELRVDDRVVRRDVVAGTVVGPLGVAAGSHVVSLVPAAGAPITATVVVAAGRSVDVVAHLPADVGGAPKLTAFPDDLSAVGPGKSRLAVAHTAQVPPADIRVDGKPLLTNVANAEVLTVEVPATTYSVDVVATGTQGPAVLGPVDLTLRAGTLTRVYAFGSPAKGTMDVVVHVLPLRQQGARVPASVQTGTGGQLADLLARRR